MVYALGLHRNCVHSGMALRRGAAQLLPKLLQLEPAVGPACAHKLLSSDERSQRFEPAPSHRCKAENITPALNCRDSCCLNPFSAFASDDQSVATRKPSELVSASQLSMCPPYKIE